MADVQPTKLCPKCERCLPLSAYGRDKHRVDGVTCWCRECRVKSTCAWQTENKTHRNSYVLKLRSKDRQRHRDQANARRAANPEKHRAQDRQRYKRNRASIRKVKNAWLKAHPDYVRRRNRIYYLRHKAEFISRYVKAYRARKKNAPGFYTQEDVKRIHAAQRGRCAYCRTPLRGKWHEDHIIPLVKGGTNWPSNIQLTCEPCNLSKGGTDPLHFARRRGFLL